MRRHCWVLASQSGTRQCLCFDLVDKLAGGPGDELWNPTAAAMHAPAPRACPAGAARWRARRWRAPDPSPPATAPAPQSAPRRSTASGPTPRTSRTASDTCAHGHRRLVTCRSMRRRAARMLTGRPNNVTALHVSAWGSHHTLLVRSQDGQVAASDRGPASAPVDVAQLQLQVDVRLEQLVLGAAADGHAQDLPRRIQPQLPDLEVRRHHPHLLPAAAGLLDKLSLNIQIAVQSSHNIAAGAALCAHSAAGQRSGAPLPPWRR